MDKKILLLCSIFGFLKISQAEVKLPEYSDDSGLTCNSILITDDFLKMANRITIEDCEGIYKKELQRVVDLLAVSKTSEDFMIVADKISVLLCFFEDEDLDLLEDIYLNLQMRAALMGNSTAIYEIVNLSFPVRKESLEKNFTLHGIPMSQDQFLSIPQKISEKQKEYLKTNLLSEVLSEL